jgi:hypothetical protein
MVEIIRKTRSKIIVKNGYSLCGRLLTCRLTPHRLFQVTAGIGLLQYRHDIHLSITIVSNLEPLHWAVEMTSSIHFTIDLSKHAQTTFPGKRYG